MSDFSFRYTEGIHFKDCIQEPPTKKKFGRNQENNAIAQHAVDEIILQEKEKLSVKDETHEKIDD